MTEEDGFGFSAAVPGTLLLFLCRSMTRPLRCTTRSSCLGTACGSISRWYTPTSRHKWTARSWKRASNIHLCSVYFVCRGLNMCLRYRYKCARHFVAVSNQSHIAVYRSTWHPPKRTLSAFSVILISFFGSAPLQRNWVVVKGFIHDRFWPRGISAKRIIYGSFIVLQLKIMAFVRWWVLTDLALLIYS